MFRSLFLAHFNFSSWGTLDLAQCETQQQNEAAEVTLDQQRKCHKLKYTDGRYKTVKVKKNSNQRDSAKLIQHKQPKYRNSNYAAVQRP